LPLLQLIEEFSFTFIRFPLAFPSALFKRKKIDQNLLQKKIKYDFMFSTKVTNLIIANHMAAIVANAKL
jgi:hypothetical protein